MTVPSSKKSSLGQSPSDSLGGVNGGRSVGTLLASFLLASPGIAVFQSESSGRTKCGRFETWEHNDISGGLDDRLEQCEVFMWSMVL